MAPSSAHLGRARINQLLAAIGSAPTPDEAPPQASPYDWRDPHYFNANQKNRLGQALGPVAARMAEIFTRSRRSEVEVRLKAVTQHFAGDLCRRLELDQAFCLTFAPDKGQPCGFVSVAPQTCTTWVTWLLGDTDSARDPNQGLSPLEESLLSDLLITVLDAFLTPLRAQHNLQPADALVKGQPGIQYELTEELARIVFQIKDPSGGEPAEIAFLVPGSRLTALADKPAPAPTKVTPQELSLALREYVQEMPVTVKVTLAATLLPFQELLDLGPGDILLLDQSINKPVELILDGRTVSCGRPAQSGGRYAVVVAESQAAGNPQPTPAKGPK